MFALHEQACTLVIMIAMMSFVDEVDIAKYIPIKLHVLAY